MSVRWSFAFTIDIGTIFRLHISIAYIWLFFMDYIGGLQITYLRAASHGTAATRCQTNACSFAFNKDLVNYTLSVCGGTLFLQLYKLAANVWHIWKMNIGIDHKLKRSKHLTFSLVRLCLRLHPNFTTHTLKTVSHWFVLWAGTLETNTDGGESNSQMNGWDTRTTYYKMRSHLLVPCAHMPIEHAQLLFKFI